MFIYTTIDKFRGLSGIASGTLPDAGVLEKLELAGIFVNKVTKQFFTPVFQIVRFDGRWDSLTHHPDLVPIVRIFGLSISWNNSRRSPIYLTPYPYNWYSFHSLNEEIENIEYEISADKRLLELISGKFPKGVSNILIDGVFGWLNEIDRGVYPFETETLGSITENDSSVEVLSTEGLNVGDVVDFFIKERVEPTQEVSGTLSPEAWPQAAVTVQRIITAVDRGTTTISFDPILQIPRIEGVSENDPLPAGAPVRRYGRVPTGIAEVAAWVATQLAREEANLSTGGGSAVPHLSDLKREKTDLYEVELRDGAGVTEDGMGEWTGNKQMDAILADYMAPVRLAVV